MLVGCAIIEQDGKILISQRCSDDSYGDYWEFPGGKKERDETMEQCLCREVLEETDITIEPRFFLAYKKHEYPKKTVHLYFYVCDYVSGTPATKECQDVKWVALEQLRNENMLPGDVDIVEDLITRKDHYFGS